MPEQFWKKKWYKIIKKVKSSSPLTPSPKSPIQERAARGVSEQETCVTETSDAADITLQVNKAPNTKQAPGLSPEQTDELRWYHAQSRDYLRNSLIEDKTKPKNEFLFIRRPPYRLQTSWTTEDLGAGCSKLRLEHTWKPHEAIKVPKEVYEEAEKMWRRF